MSEIRKINYNLFQDTTRFLDVFWFHRNRFGRVLTCFTIYWKLENFRPNTFTNLKETGKTSFILKGGKTRPDDENSKGLGSPLVIWTPCLNSLSILEVSDIDLRAIKPTNPAPGGSSWKEGGRWEKLYKKLLFHMEAAHAVAVGNKMWIRNNLCTVEPSLKIYVLLQRLHLSNINFLSTTQCITDWTEIDSVISLRVVSVLNLMGSFTESILSMFTHSKLLQQKHTLPTSPKRFYFRSLNVFDLINQCEQNRIGCVQFTLKWTVGDFCKKHI